MYILFQFNNIISFDFPCRHLVLKLTKIDHNLVILIVFIQYIQTVLS